MRLSDMDRLISSERLRAYPLMLVAGYLACAAYILLTLQNGVDLWGRTPGSDFITFYAAADLVRQGNPAAVFDMAQIAAAERAIAPVNGVYLWHYPPPFLLMVAPFAYLPYGVALALWTAATLGVFLWLIRTISDHRLALLLALGFPAVFINVMHGQNATLSVAILGVGLMSLDRRPIVAGLVLGLLVYKPHLGVLLPLLLGARGHWKTFAAAAFSASLLCLASYAAFGLQPWAAFLQDLPSASALVTQGGLPWSKIPSVAVAVLSLGAPPAVAYGIHILVAAAMTVLTFIAWRGEGPLHLKIAMAVPTILAISPYCFDYDLVLLALPIGLLAEYGRREPLPDGVKTSLALAYFSPILFGALATVSHVQLMPLGVIAVFLAALRTLAAAEAATTPPLMLGQASMRTLFSRSQ